VIEKLDNNEQILLMYVTDELPPEDRHEVDQMLAVDANLRDELQRLEEADGMLRQAMAAVDAESVPASREGAAVSRVSREIRRRVVRSAAPAEPHVSSDRRRSLWWLYPTAAAAVIILAAALWMPRHTTTPIGPFGSTPAPDRFAGFYGMNRLFQESWDEPESSDTPSAPDDAVAMTDGPRETGMPVDPLSQLLLSADANQ
jgi:hypothetical protein